METFLFVLVLLSASLLTYLLEGLVGMFLSLFPKTHKLGIRLWNSSGFFLSKIPSSCRSNRCGDCGNWTCPNFEVEYSYSKE